MYIVAVIIAVTLIAILFFALRSTVKRIDYNTKKYFIDKLQDYDYLIEEKKKIIDELNKKIEDNKKVISKEEKDTKKSVDIEKNSYQNNSKIPKYRDEDLFKKYKDIKNKFSFNKENLIRKFLVDVVKQEDNNYEALVKIRKKFTNNIIYEIIKLRSNEQLNYVIKLLTKDEFMVIEKYIEKNRFKINTFITKIETLIEKNDPAVYIYTGQKNESFNHISPLIKTKYDNRINEGIKINYKGNLYDYSL